MVTGMRQDRSRRRNSLHLAGCSFLCYDAF